MVDAIKVFISQVDYNWIIQTIILLIVVTITTIILVKLTNKLFKRMVNKSVEKGYPITILSFIRYLLLGIIYFSAIVTVITTIKPMENLVKSLFAGSSVVALVIGLASQEAVGNIVSGFLILTFKPFVIGDSIKYVDKNIVGTVEDITLRHTTIKTLENKRVIVPNGIINKEVIENANYKDAKVCAFVDIGITYESDIDLAKKIMREQIIKHPFYLDNIQKDVDAQVIVRVIELGESAVKLRAWVWTENMEESFILKCDLYETIKKAFDKNDVHIAYPHLMVVKK